MDRELQLARVPVRVVHSVAHYNFGGRVRSALERVGSSPACRSPTASTGSFHRSYRIFDQARYPGATFKASTNMTPTIDHRGRPRSDISSVVPLAVRRAAPSRLSDREYRSPR